MSKDWSDANADDISIMYYQEHKTLYEIGKVYGVSETSVRRFMNKHNLIRRFGSPSPKQSIDPDVNPFHIQKESVTDIVNNLEILKNLDIESYKQVPRENITVPVPLKMLESDDDTCTLTLSASDFHLGHSTFLPATYESSCITLFRVMDFLSKRFKVVKLNVVFNGDIVSGRNVYDTQFLDNLIPKGNWQVFLAEIVLTELLEELQKYCLNLQVYIIKGNHEDIGDNYPIYLKKALESKFKTIYLSRGQIINIADTIGKYNILFTHGKGRSDYFPVSQAMIRDIWKVVSQYKTSGVVIEKVSLGHTHLLSPELDIEGMNIGVTGGFQKWEYSVSQRPCGMLLYLYSNGECSVIPIRPNIEIETNEKQENALEYKNMKWYAEKLLKHISKIEGIHA